MAEHYWYEVFTARGLLAAGPASFLLVFFLAYLAFLIAKGPLFYLLGTCFRSLMLEDIEIDEDIDRYQNCLDEDDKNWTI